MSKTITFAGVSRLNGVLKFRTATEDKRFAQLAKLGDTDIEFTGVNAATKSQAAKELLARNFANGRAEIEALLVGVASDDNPFKRMTKTVTVTVPNRAIAELTGAKVKVTRGVFGKVYPEIPMTPAQAERIRNEFNAKNKAL